MWIRSFMIVAAVAACGSSSKPASGVSNTSNATPSQPAIEPLPLRELTASWIRKLGDPQEAERAVTELEQLGDPGAIEALGQHWRDDGRPVRVLQVMIALARPLTPEQAKAQYVLDYETTGRPASWDRLLPFVRTAIASIDIANPRSVDSAAKAAQVAEEAKLTGAVAELIELASQPENKKSISAQIAAIRAIGAIGTGQGTAALVALIGREPPAHPRSGKTSDQKRALEEKFGLYLMRTGASINAVGTLPSAAAAEVLIKQLYITPELFIQIRRALVANGPLVAEPMRRVLRGKHAAVNDLIAQRKLGQYCGDAGDLPPADCKPVSIRDFYAAAILGDLHDPAAVPDLLEALQRPAAPYYYMDDQAGPNTQHHAIFDSLRKLGAAEAAAPVLAIWKNPKLDADRRALAAGTYAYLARTDAEVDALGKIAADNTADDGLRQEAASAYARLARDPKHIKPLLVLAQKYVDASAKKSKEAAAAKPAATKADAVLEQQKKLWEAAKVSLVRVANDTASTTAQIKAATKAATTAEQAYKTAKTKHREQTATFRQTESAAGAYTGYARMFQTHVARIEIANRCKDDVQCYGASLVQTPAMVEANVVAHIPDVASWTSEEKEALLEASIERGMLELAKRGRATTKLTDALLDGLTSDRRLVRASILLALPHVAALPCTRCVTRLDAALVADEGKTTLAPLEIETTLLRNYFRWAK